jgi:hypothetical protein
MRWTRWGGHHDRVGGVADEGVPGGAHAHRCSRVPGEADQGHVLKAATTWSPRTPQVVTASSTWVRDLGLNTTVALGGAERDVMDAFSIRPSTPNCAPSRRSALHWPTVPTHGA